MSNSRAPRLVAKPAQHIELRDVSTDELTFALAGVCAALERLTGTQTDTAMISNLSGAAHILSQALVSQV